LFTLAAAISLFLISMLFSVFVNVNLFSLHALYRNRLIKTFVGASNVDTDDEDEQRNRFDGFSDGDNLAMAVLRTRPREIIETDVSDVTARRLFPVLNMSLNVLASKNLAWQERKAEAFISTPLYTGAHLTGYRPSEHYATGGMPKAGDLSRGISL